MELLRRISGFARAHGERPAYVAPTGETPVAWASRPCAESPDNLAPDSRSTGFRPVSGPLAHGGYGRTSASATPAPQASSDNSPGMITYADLAQAIESLSFPSRIAEGDRVILRGGNVLAFAPAFLSLIAHGVDVLLLSEKTAPAEVDHFAQLISANAILSASEPPPAISPRPPSPRPGSLLLATSGTTGTPKVVIRTAASLDAVARNCAEAIGFTPADHVLAAVPLTHSYGIEHGLLAPLWAGSTVILARGLDLLSLTAALSRQITILPAVPTMIEALADATGQLADLRQTKVYSAGAPLPDVVRQRFSARYRTHVGQLYGSTEIGSVTYRPGDSTSPPNDVGRPMQGVRLHITDAGELSVVSPSMFQGYAGDSHAGHRAHGTGHPTGDLARLTSQGTLQLDGRSSLLIDIGGLKVNPLEVEAVLRDHPEIADCVVLPFAQTETVNRLRAIVVPRDASQPPSERSLRSHVQLRLAPHKVPRLFEFAASLPRTAAGKVDRRHVFR